MQTLLGVWGKSHPLHQGIAPLSMELSLRRGYPHCEFPLPRGNRVTFYQRHPVILDDQGVSGRTNPPPENTP